MKQAGQFRPGVAVTSEFPPTTFSLGRKNFNKHNIVVGEDPAQIRFISDQLGLEPVLVEKVTDDMLLGKEAPSLYRVTASHRIDLSPDVKEKTGIWSADPVTRGTAALNALVKFAASLLSPPVEKPTREQIEIVGKEVTRQLAVDDIRGALWRAALCFTEEIKARPQWKEPWEDWRGWMDCQQPAYRLHSLYKTLVAWVYLHTDRAAGAKQLGVSPSRQRRLQSLNLDPQKVSESIQLLSAWRTRKSNPFVCAYQVSVAWS